VDRTVLHDLPTKVMNFFSRGVGTEDRKIL